MDGKNSTPCNETEYEMLFNLRDTAILYDRLNPDNRHLKDVIDMIDERIGVLNGEIEVDIGIQ